jgi:hypothetical protein
MGLFSIVTGTVEVVPVPGFHLAIAPVRVAVPFGSVSMVCEFVLTIARDAGHLKTVWLDLAGMAGNWTFSADNFVAGVDAPITLTVDAAGMPSGMVVDFDVAGYDDIADRPPV